MEGGDPQLSQHSHCAPFLVPACNAICMLSALLCHVAGNQNRGAQSQENSRSIMKRSEAGWAAAVHRFCFRHCLANAVRSKNVRSKGGWEKFIE